MKIVLIKLRIIVYEKEFFFGNKNDMNNVDSFLYFILIDLRWNMRIVKWFYVNIIIEDIDKLILIKNS